MTTSLAPGDPAPAFSLPDAHGDTVALASFGPGKVIVYFYPAALTPGCTTEAVDFSAALDDFARAGYRVVGISPDQPDKLQRFTDKEHLRVTLLADPATTTIAAYGAYGERTVWGKAVTGVIRSTFVVDVDDKGQGTIAMAEYNVRATGHVAKLRRELGIDDEAGTTPRSAA